MDLSLIAISAGALIPEYRISPELPGFPLAQDRHLNPAAESQLHGVLPPAHAAAIFVIFDSATAILAPSHHPVA